MEIPDYSLEKCHEELDYVRRRICIYDRYSLDEEEVGYERYLCYLHYEVNLLRRIATLKEATVAEMEQYSSKRKEHSSIGMWRDEFENGKQQDRHYNSKFKDWTGELRNGKYEGIWQFDNYNYKRYSNGITHGRFMFNHFVHTEQAVLVHKGFTWKGKGYGCYYRLLLSE